MPTICYCSKNCVSIYCLCITVMKQYKNYNTFCCVSKLQTFMINDFANLIMSNISPFQNPVQ